MKLTKGKISKLYNKKNQSLKKKQKQKKRRNRGRTFRKYRKVNLARRSLKKLKGGEGPEIPIVQENVPISKVKILFQGEKPQEYNVSQNGDMVFIDDPNRPVVSGIATINPAAITSDQPVANAVVEPVVAQPVANAVVEPVVAQPITEGSTEEIAANFTKAVRGANEILQQPQDPRKALAKASGTLASGAEKGETDKTQLAQNLSAPNLLAPNPSAQNPSAQNPSAPNPSAPDRLDRDNPAVARQISPVDYVG
jgi:hypothetical protein